MRDLDLDEEIVRRIVHICKVYELNPSHQTSYIARIRIPEKSKAGLWEMVLVHYKTAEEDPCEFWILRRHGYSFEINEYVTQVIIADVLDATHIHVSWDECENVILQGDADDVLWAVHNLRSAMKYLHRKKGQRAA